MVLLVKDCLIYIKMEIKYQIIIVLLISSISFIVYDQGNEYLEEQKQISYDRGRVVGELEWNQQVMNIVNNQGVLPYWIYSNNTNQYIIQTIPLVNLCENFR